MKRRRLKVRRLLAGAAIVGVTLIVTLATFPFRLLCVTSRLEPSDAIVVLGGESLMRAEHAARLARNGLAPLVFVSGRGDCEIMQQVLARHGVQTNVIELEGLSTTTQENALYTVKLLRERKCRRVILVTSWFHSRRSLGSFRKYAPEIEFLSAPAPRTVSWKYERRYIASEYLKTAWYAIRFGIWPTFGS
jgi:uncharacterized SAM-binding protein YcdF (DUF218 family)